MIKLFKYKTNKKNNQNKVDECCLHKLKLDEQLTYINKQLKERQKAIELLHIHNDENRQEIQELKKTNKILANTIRAFLIYFIIRN